MSRAYLSGPMKDIAENNFPLFIRFAALLKERGWDIISPVDLNIAAGVKSTDTEFTEEQMIKLIADDSAAILSLRPSAGDAVLVMEDWFNRGAKSRGVFAELALADWIGLPVYLVRETGAENPLLVTIHRLFRDRDTNVWLFDPEVYSDHK